jgi:uncharacterized protein (DUF433 family)
VDWREHIDSKPEVVHGQLCFKGTRIPVSVVLDNLAAGLSPEEILRSYPSMTGDHVRAAVAYAAELVRERVIDLRQSA